LLTVVNFIGNFPKNVKICLELTELLQNEKDVMFLEPPCSLNIRNINLCQIVDLHFDNYL